MSAGLSQLGKTANGLSTAFLRLDINGTSMRTVEALAQFKDLQVLNLAGNELRELSHLSQLPNLVELDVQDNQLVDVSGDRGRCGPLCLQATRRQQHKRRQEQKWRQLRRQQRHQQERQEHQCAVLGKRLALEASIPM